MPSHSITRRDLLSSAAAVGIAASVASCGTSPEPEEMQRKTGIQLYTLRDAMSQDVAATLQAVAGIGYKEVEFAGYFDLPASEMRKLIDDLGLEAPSAHFPGPALRDNLAPLLDFAAEMGHRYVVLPWLSDEDRLMIDQYRGWAEVLNTVGEACQQMGMRAAYHNHDFEFITLDGEEPFTVLMNETDPSLVDFELDFFWVRKAGLEVLDVIARAPERFTLSHIKDIDAFGNMVDVGSGTIDFAGILGNPKASAIAHCYVEHDNPPDAFKSAAFSHFSLQAILS